MIFTGFEEIFQLFKSVNTCKLRKISTEKEFTLLLFWFK